MLLKKSSYEIDMLHGPLTGKLLRFTLPIALSSMIQQLFNAADTAVVGYFRECRRTGGGRDKYRDHRADRLSFLRSVPRRQCPDRGQDWKAEKR